MTEIIDLMAEFNFTTAPRIVESCGKSLRRVREGCNRYVALAGAETRKDGMKKARKKKFDRGTEARRAARNSGAAPAVTRVIEDKRKRPPKHRKKAELERDAMNGGI
jgi:hypothetical protein